MMSNQIKILITDDALFMRQLIRNLLQEAGFSNIIEASNGKEALNIYKNNQIDLMICDVVMPEMNGLEAIEEIIKYDPNATIIMLSALDEQETVINALHLGAKDYLVKPVNKRHFIRTIRRVLAIDSIENDKALLLEIYSQILDDLENYIDSALSAEMRSQLSYILRSIEIDHPKALYYDEKRNRIKIKDTGDISFELLNNVLIDTLEKAKTKVEAYIPYAKNIFSEAFRFVYLRNKKQINKMAKPISYPDWLEKEVNFVNQVMDYLFSKDKK